MSRKPKTFVTTEEYLAFERAAEYKNEYFDGEIVVMTGASRRHNLINVNVLSEFWGQLKKAPCEVYPSKMRVRIPAANLYTYPDYGRTLKSSYYRTLESLKEYLLISQDEYKVEQCVRQPDGRWLLTDIVSLEGRVELASVPCALELREIHHKVNLT